MNKSHIGSGNFTYFSNEVQVDNGYQCYNSPEDATEAALLYTLKNLI